jgi:hypothetical protein
MPPTASLRSASAPQASAAPVQPVIPFTAAAHRHIEPITVDSPAILGAAQQQRGPFDIPAYGFIRHVILEVSFSGGTLGAGVLSPDWPWNVLQNVTLSDVNGAPIFGPLDGYALLQANIAGGYAYRQDPRLDPNYDGTINGRFFLRIPVEISKHNAYGALANQNAAAAYKLSYTINTAAARVDTVMPDPLNLFWDARSLTQETQQLRIKLGMEAIQAPGIRDTGVFLFLFDDLTIGHAGDEEPNLWLPTVQASRLELNGVSAVAGTLQVMTNDIAPVAVDPSQRYVETSQTGFHPAMGQPTPQGA